MRILVVDDDKVNNKMLKLQLEKRGFEIEQAFNGAEALKVVETKDVDLILLDIMMPDMSGSSVLKQLRTKYTAFQLPIIMQTGLSESDKIVENLRLGANDYLVKPVNIEVAMARINTQLHLKQLEERNRTQAQLATAHSMIVTYNHEINNPLTIALGMTKKIYKATGSMDAEKAIEAMQRVASIVKKIEQVSRSGDLQTKDYSDSEQMLDLKKSE